MAKVSTKPNKKEEQKKLAVRIVCLVLVVALAVTSLLAMFPYLFQRNESYSVEDLLAAGVIYLGEDGKYYFTDEYLHAIEDTEHDHE